MRNKFLSIFLFVFLLGCNKVEVKYNVTITGEHIHYDENYLVATQNQDYFNKITCDEGYVLDTDEEIFNITVSDKSIGNFFLYSEGILKIFADVVQGDIKINVTPAYGEYLFTLNIGENYKNSSTSYVISMEYPEIDIKIQSNDGYKVNSDIEVLPAGKVNYEFNKTTDSEYNFKIPSSELKRDITVNVKDAIAS